MEMMYEESTTSTTAVGSPRLFAFGEAGRLARGAEPLVEWAKYGIELGSHQRAPTADGAYGPSRLRSAVSISISCRRRVRRASSAWAGHKKGNVVITVTRKGGGG